MILRALLFILAIGCLFDFAQQYQQPRLPMKRADDVDRAKYKAYLEEHYRKDD